MSSAAFDRQRPAVLVFVGSLCLYLAAAYLMNVRSGAMFGDAFARVAMAHQVLTSRDPSLADIGFVWSPLPTLALLPLVALADWWPALLRDGFASNIVSSLCMAGAVVVVWLTLGDFGARRWVRVLFTTMFALHPMVLTSGANGMSEAMLCLFSLLGIRALARWLQGREARHLMAAGVHIGVAYLVRYEALTSAAAVVTLVVAVTFLRTPASWRDRISDALADGLVVAFPPLVAFVGWAVASWLIVGRPFEQFSSAYGNSAQIANSGIAPADAGFVARQLVLLAPALPLVVGTALLAGWRRHDARSLASLAVCGAPLVFHAVAASAGATFGWLRFYLLAIPLTILLAGYVAAAPIPGGSAQRWRTRAVLTSGIAVIAVVSSIATTGVVFTNPLLASDEYALLQALTGNMRPDNPHTKQRFQGERKVAIYLDDRNLPEGSVLLDSWGGYAIVAASDNPPQFVLNVDRDFFAALARPHAFVKYLLVPGGKVTAELDALNRSYPGLYDGKVPSTTLVREFTGGQITWRLYRLDTLAVAGSWNVEVK
jgi:Dolichyl-phosphate-mannose-protein mannosyltransferase